MNYEIRFVKFNVLLLLRRWWCWLLLLLLLLLLSLSLPIRLHFINQSHYRNSLLGMSGWWCACSCVFTPHLCKPRLYTTESVFVCVWTIAMSASPLPAPRVRAFSVSITMNQVRIAAAARQRGKKIIKLVLISIAYASHFVQHYQHNFAQHMNNFDLSFYVTTAQPTPPLAIRHRIFHSLARTHSWFHANNLICGQILLSERNIAMANGALLYNRHLSWENCVINAACCCCHRLRCKGKY